ncbi:MAG: helix-turn-helix domain-containing protein [Rhodoferax sp.]
MSEAELAAPEETASAPVPTQPPAGRMTAGALLRQAREAQGLHIAALAVSLKVPVKKIEALESDRFDLLPDTVFVRALAASVCRSLKIDLEPILEKLPHTVTPHLRSYASSVNVPFRSSSGYSTGMLREQMSKPLAWVVAALVAGALALVLLPFARPGADLAAAKPDVADVTSLPALQVTPVLAGAEAAVPQTGVAHAGAPAAAELVAGSGAVSGVVVFKARAQSWVEVVDASGVVQVRRNLAAGEVMGASGALPLTVVVGRADTTVVEVHGKPFDLLSIAKENMARFEVN